jgi:ABC-2 type transport system permease protein
MRLFSKLILNEFYKSFLQKKTILLFVVIVIATAFLAYFFQKDDVKDWRKVNKETIVELEKRKSEEIKSKDTENDQELQYLEGQIKLKKYQLKHNMPENVQTPLLFIYNSSVIISLIIMLFMAAFSADVIAGEYTGGTIRQILVKPIKRWKIFLAKYCSTILVSSILFAFYLVIATIIGYLVFGDNQMSIFTAELSENQIFKINMLSNIAWTIAAQLFLLAIVTTITFLIATITRKSSLAIIVTVVFIFGGGAIADLLIEYDFYKYILMPNLELNGYLPGETAPIEGATFMHSLMVCLAYAAVCFAAGITIYNKRDVF